MAHLIAQNNDSLDGIVGSAMEGVLQVSLPIPSPYIRLERWHAHVKPGI